MKRRTFIAGLGGVAAAWPLVARAQQGERFRRIGVLTFAAEDTEIGRMRAFREALRKLGWIDGRTLQIDFRFGAGDPDRTRAFAAELVSLGPEVIVTSFRIATTTVQQQTKTIPIIFAGIGDPVASGTVRNVARPEGNTTGFTNLNASFGGRWPELLKEVAPSVTRVGLISNAAAPTSAYIPYIEAAARSLAMQTIKIPPQNAEEIEPAFRAFAVEPKGGLIVLPNATSLDPRELVRAAARHQLPAIYGNRDFVENGGLMSYGSSYIDIWRQTASYVDRILRGAKPSDLPVQFPTKFEMAVNLKTAKALGLTVPQSILLRADEVIE
jgi:putative tryptophan/tyrosine transport system substrate-binding protein